MDRKNVYAIINGEREFQEHFSGSQERPDMLAQMSMGDLLGAMECNLTKAKEAWYRDHGQYQNTMEYIRKVLALGVKAAEIFGMPERQYADPLAEQK